MKKGLLVGEELREALGEESGGVGDKERVVGEENCAVEGIDGGDPSGVVTGVGGRGGSSRRCSRRGGGGIVLGKGGGEESG